MQKSILILNTRLKKFTDGSKQAKVNHLDPCHAWNVSGQEVRERNMLDQFFSHQEKEDVAFGKFDRSKVG